MISVFVFTGKEHFYWRCLPFLFSIPHSSTLPFSTYTVRCWFFLHSSARGWEVSSARVLTYFLPCFVSLLCMCVAMTIYSSVITGYLWWSCSWQVCSGHNWLVRAYIHELVSVSALCPSPHTHTLTFSRPSLCAVEDPSPEFSTIRDYVDCKNAMNFECFQLPMILEPYSAEMEKICREKLKLHKVRIQCNFLKTFLYSYVGLFVMFSFSSRHSVVECTRLWDWGQLIAATQSSTDSIAWLSRTDLMDLIRYWDGCMYKGQLDVIKEE